MENKSIKIKWIVFLAVIIIPGSLFGETEYYKEMNKCKYTKETCYKECLKKDVEAKTKPAKSKVEECLRECDFYDDLCMRIVTKLYNVE